MHPDCAALLLLGVQKSPTISFSLYWIRSLWVPKKGRIAGAWRSAVYRSRWVCRALAQRLPPLPSLLVVFSFRRLRLLLSSQGNGPGCDRMFPRFLPAVGLLADLETRRRLCGENVHGQRDQ